MNSTPPTSLPCFLVNNLTASSMEQCKFIIDNDCLEEDSLIDYVYLVYCDFGQELRYASILLVASLVILLFLALSAVADEFLCPSLLTVAKNLRMSDSLAGVTLLAFGNGCPDIFSSLAAASGDRPELIVGELLGAGIFCTSIVAGLIFISNDFKLACRPILRDTTFYLLAVYLIWYYCWSEQITFYGSLAFIIIYVIYLIVALSGQAINSRLQGDYSIAEKQAEIEAAEKEKNGNWFKWREESFRRRQLAQMMKKLETCPLTTSQTPRVEYNNGVTSIHLGFESCANAPAARSPLEAQLSSKIRPDPNGGFVNSAFHLDGSGLETSHSRDSQQAKQKEAAEKQHNTKPYSYTYNNNHNHYPTQTHQVPIHQQQVLKLEHKRNSTSIANECSDLNFNEWDDFLAHINPIHSADWYELNVATKVIKLLRAPILFATIITVPVVDHDRRLNNWCRLLNSIHCITVPLALIIAFRSATPDYLSVLFGYLPLPILFLIPGISMAIFVLKTTSAHEPPKYHAVFAYFGFMMSIMWIYLLASEIIGLLKTVGIMFSMTDTAIGLGILAWGNSLGDIVANTSLAEAGYPRMAIGATIGAPLLNLLLGFGLSFTFSLSPGEYSVVEYSPTITLLCSTLAILLISLMMTTLVPPEKSKRPFGYVLICGYGLYFLLAVCLEYGWIDI